MERPQTSKTPSLYRLTTVALDVSPPDWLQPFEPYDATGEAETEGWKITQCLNGECRDGSLHLVDQFPSGSPVITVVYKISHLEV